MRILGWMHRKLRLNSGDSLKDFNMGKSCQEECKAAFSRGGRNSSDDYALYAKSFGVKSEGQEEEDTLSDLFTHWHQGLLAIGTLGAETVERPLSASDEEEEGDDAIKDAIGLLEKIAAAEGSHKDEVLPNDCHGDASAKHPLPAAEGAKPEALPQIQGPRVAAFGSGMDNTLMEKENRVCLRDLFSENKAAADENGRPDNKAGKMDGAKAVQLIIKKILKRRTGSSKTSASKDHVAAENKMHKLFHMFNRKVHPSDYCTAATAAATAEAAAVAAAATKKGTNSYIMKSAKDNNLVGDKEKPIHVDPTIAKEKGWPCKGHPTPPDLPICRSESNGNREHWIKTDADFLVLEL